MKRILIIALLLALASPLFACPMSEGKGTTDITPTEEGQTKTPSAKT